MIGRKWSKERVVAEIQAHRQIGVAWKSVVQRDSALIAAGRRYFGNWGKALLAAGIPPEALGKWTRQRVLEAIQQWDWGRGPMSSRRISRAFSSAVYRFFGSWADAVAAAGMDPCQARSFQRWTKQRRAASDPRPPATGGLLDR